jgi:dolichyl-phosphate beta-glucosyltransferase
MEMKYRGLLVIPHYKDTERLRPFLDGLLQTFNHDLAILVSDDGSGSEDFSRLQELIKAKREELKGRTGDFPELLDPITAPKNRGKGAAVYSGLAAGGEKFDLLAFADADGAVSPREILRAWRYFCNNLDHVDLLIGSRIKMLGRKVDRRLERHLAGRVFATLVANLTGLEVYDSQCGMKLMKRAVFNDIHPHCENSGFAFDVEMLLLAKKFSYRIEEFPVDWADVSGGKVSLVRHSARMLLDILETTRRLKSLRVPKNGPRAQ